MDPQEECPKMTAHIKRKTVVMPIRMDAEIPPKYAELAAAQSTPERRVTRNRLMEIQLAEGVGLGSKYRDKAGRLDMSETQEIEIGDEQKGSEE